MKKFVLIVGVLFLAFSSLSYAKSSHKHTDDEEEDDTDSSPSSILQIVTGPMIDVKNFGSNFYMAGITVGGKYKRFGLAYAQGGGLKSVRPYLLIDIPFTFNTGEVSQMAIGPIIDIGPAIGFAAGQKIIDVMQVGFGLDVKFYFNDSIGLSLSPVHFTSSFATYTTGGTGLVKQFRMTYDILFSFLLRW
ncbi:MAG: hypothetical protein V1647_04050 [Pseudomonadota bacterium]